MTTDFDKGQHMLIDREVLEKEIEAADLSEEDSVIEIGAGTGVLTEELVKRAGKVLAFEIDERFREQLDKLESKNLKLVFEDALKNNWEGYNKIVSNIPYFLSEQIIMKAIESDTKTLVLIVGEEFKNKVAAGDEKTGVIINLFFKMKPLGIVKGESFLPKTKVNSWIIRLTRKSEEKNKVLRRIVMKKAKIKNAIIFSLVEFGKTKNEAREILKTLEISPQVLNKPIQKSTGKFLLFLKKKLEDNIA